MDASLLYQDNMSAILLETNGKASSSKHTKHIKVKYFFIKDKVDQGEITIEHCPTKQMWTDINTKLKQGLAFRVFCGHVMGIPADYKDSDYEGKVPLMPVVSMLPLTKEQLALQECVGERTNGALKSALRTSTFKTSGKQVFVFNFSGKRIPVSSGKRNNSNSDSILDGYYDRLISNLDGLKPSKIKASHLKLKLGDSSLTI